MNEADDFYGQEEEGFEELVEKNLGIDHDSDDGEIEEDLLSDLEEIDETEFGENSISAKREERLQSVMNMTRNPLATFSTTESKDEQAIKRKVAMLCSALGGFDPNPPNKYILGIEALGCLKDLKELLKRIDEERGVWSVTSACHDSGLFVNDLIPIMVEYGSTDAANADSETTKILLATIELMVRLLTPLRLENTDSDNKQELHFKLKRAQIEYKYHLLHYKKGKIFKYLIAMMIPILQLDLKNVARRDNIILNLCLTLFANVLRIQPSDARSAKKGRNNHINVFETLPAGITEEDIAMDVVLAVFKKYQVLSVVQTVASNLSKEFDTEILGAACLDFYFYSFANIDPTSLTDEVTVSSIPDSLSKRLNLSDAQDEENSHNVTSINNRLNKLLQVENKRKKELYSKNSTRHAKFGSLINIQNNKQNRVISGQKNLLSQNVLQILDSNESKTGSGKPLARREKDNLAPQTFIKLNYKTRELLAKFVEDFIQNGFGVVCREIYNVLLKNKEVDDYTFHYHYYSVANWILKYERSYQAVHPKNVKTLERYKYLFYWFSKNIIQSLINFVLFLAEKKVYDVLVMTISILKELMQAAIQIHSYEHFDTSRLLNDDKVLLNTLVTRGEGTIRLIFSVNSEIQALLKLPKDSHRKSSALALEMIEFTRIVLKVIKYIQHLKVPIILTSRHVDDYDDEGGLEGGDDFRVNPKRIHRYKTLDKNQCDKFKEILFNDQTVSTHIWLFMQYEELNETKLNTCLSYFSKLLENWEDNILKLVRLDFMLTLYRLKDSQLPASMKMEFGEILNFFMHKLGKMFSNTPTVLLEPMIFNEVNDTEIKQYYLTGDAFATYDMTERERRNTTKNGNLDVKFVDATVSDNQKISLIVSHLYYEDKTQLLEEFIKFLNQWYNELNNNMNDDVEKVSKLNLFRLEGQCYKESRTNPYFRLLCKIGNIVNGVLIKRDADDLDRIKQSIEVSMNTPLDSFELEDKFIDPNIAQQELKKMRLKKRNRNGSDDEDNYDDIEGDGYADDYNGYGEEGIDDGDSNEDLAGSESDEQDALELMEAKLSSMTNRVKGKAMTRNADGELVEMGKSKKKGGRKKKSKKFKEGNLSGKKKRRLHKRRKIVQDDDEVISEAELLRRANLSKKYVEDSDEDNSNDEEFFARELKLQQLLSKRHGKITKEQYDSLMNGTLDVDDVSDLDDHQEDEPDSLGPQVAHAKPDRDDLMKLLQPSSDKIGEDSENDSEADDEEEEEDEEKDESENDNSSSDEEDVSSDDDDDDLSDINKDVENENDMIVDKPPIAPVSTFPEKINLELRKQKTPLSDNESDSFHSSEDYSGSESDTDDGGKEEGGLSPLHIEALLESEEDDNAEQQNLKSNSEKFNSIIDQQNGRKSPEEIGEKEETTDQTNDNIVDSLVTEKEIDERPINAENSKEPVVSATNDLFADLRAIHESFKNQA